MKLQNKKGFTLIELLVVITIIGILATGATTTYTSQIQKARDTTRINDIKAMQGAVEQVYQDTGEYPHPNQFNTGGTVNVSTYLPKLPRDPKNGQTCNNTGKSGGTLEPCVYVYAVGPDDNAINYGAYVLSTAFESKWKVESDATRDGWPIKFRWENGNGIMMTSKLDSDVNGTSSGSTGGCIQAALKTASGILDSACTIGTAVGDSTSPTKITIHGS